MRPRPIRGIPCRLQTTDARRTLGDVLDRIRSAQPEDYERLLGVVSEVAPLSVEETADGTLGEWKADKETDDQATWCYAKGETPGIIYVKEQLSRRKLVAIMAHELGHACTTDEDIEERGSWLEDEWASELTADWYADKRWGFGAELKSIRKRRDRMHHGAGPGESFSTEHGEFRIDEDYVCHRLP
jgi:hypothetical protein